MNIRFMCCQKGEIHGEIGIDMNKKLHFYEVKSENIEPLVKLLIERPVSGFHALEAFGTKITEFFPGQTGMGDVEQCHKLLRTK